MKEDKKSFIKSKTLWVNVIGILVIIAQSQWGYVIGPDMQVMILAGINMVLRAVTKEPVKWK